MLRASVPAQLSCDLAVAPETTRFNFAYTNAGTTGDFGGSWYFPRIVGLRRALQIALLNESIDAWQASALGLKSSVRALSMNAASFTVFREVVSAIPGKRAPRYSGA